MKTIKFEGTEYNIPTKWEDVSFIQFIRLQEPLITDHEIVSAVTGLPVADVAKSNDVKSYLEIIKSISRFSDKEPVENVPEMVTINGMICEVPKDIGFLTVAQFEDCKAIIAQYQAKYKDNEDKIALLLDYPKIVAIYLQPLLYNTDYNYNQAMELSNELYHHSCIEVISIGNFFLSNWIGLANGIQTTVLMKILAKMKATSPLYIGRLALRRLFTACSRLIIPSKMTF
jgi:hypothetical protein